MLPTRFKLLPALCLLLLPHSTSLNVADGKPRFGVASGDTASLCVVFSGSELKAGDRIALIDDSESSQRVLYAKIKSKLVSPCHDLEHSNIRGNAYSAMLDGPLPKRRLVGVIAVANPPRFKEQQGLVIGLPPRDQHELYFKSCTSSEGVHLTVWIGKPKDGRRLWHEYFYLGYDVEPSCTKAEYE